jgi:hypothetical protein
MSILPERHAFGGAATLVLALLTAVLVDAGQVAAQSVTTPEEEFGHQIGADYVLPNYTQLVAYWQKLSGESDRMVLDTIGFTEEGRPQLMAIITSPENHAELDIGKSAPGWPGRKACRPRRRPPSPKSASP